MSVSDQPPVSVVVPLYNKGREVERSPRSLLAQPFQDFEIVIVDDGSTDHGLEIVRAFTDPRIRVLDQEN